MTFQEALDLVGNTRGAMTRIAKRCGVSRQTVHAWQKAGVLPPARADKLREAV